MNCAVFLDRDGVINEDREDYVKSWEDFKFIKGVRKALKEIRQAGVPVVVITNQSAIGRGLISEDELSIIHNRMEKAVQQSGGRITKIYYCPHHPEDHCKCRKPRIGLLKKSGQGIKLGFERLCFCWRQPQGPPSPGTVPVVGPFWFKAGRGRSL